MISYKIRKFIKDRVFIKKHEFFGFIFQIENFIYDCCVCCGLEVFLVVLIRGLCF